MSGNTKQVIQDYDTVFDNPIPFRKNDPTDYVFQNTGRAGPALCALAPEAAGVPAGTAAPVTGAAADKYTLNVVDCNASVTVARRSSISVSGGLRMGVPPVPAAEPPGLYSVFCNSVAR